VSEAWVVDASPLILFARVGQLDLLKGAAPAILVPHAVIEEVRAGRERDSTAETALAWAEGYRVDDLALPPSIEHWDLGGGESQVIAHGVLGSRWVVLDDRAGRRCAEAHGVPVIGSVGIVLRCKRHGLIEKAGPVLRGLMDAGMFLDSQLLQHLLDSLGE
jgi:predicted nucleic acid-binding protein